MLGSPVAFWISPDGRHLAFATFNDTNVRDIVISKYGSPGNLKDQYPNEIKIKYPKVDIRSYIYIYIFFIFVAVRKKKKGKKVSPSPSFFNAKKTKVRRESIGYAIDKGTKIGKLQVAGLKGGEKDCTS